MKSLELEKFVLQLKNPQEELLQILIVAQGALGELGEEEINYISDIAKVSRDEIEETLEFFPFIKKKGKRLEIEVCGGLNCFLNGSDFIFTRFKELLHGREDILLSQCECREQCEYGANVYIEGESFHHVTEVEVDDLVENLK